MSTLSIIVPCHNEEKRLDIGKFLDFLGQTENTRIVFVNDGSTDNTSSVLQKIKDGKPERISIINLVQRKGKAEAVRTGLLESIGQNNFSYHGFIDADLAVSLDEMYRLFIILAGSNKKFIIGSRIKKIGAIITRNEWRHFYSRVIATLVGYIIKLDVYDTQCSAKIFNTDIVNPVFTEDFRTKWLFDVEIICRIHKQEGSLESAGLEEPLLQWTEMKGSKLRWFNFFQIVSEVFVLKKYYRSKR